MSSYYMKESTYKHDFIPQAKDSMYNKLDKPIFYNTQRYNKHSYEPDPPRPRDDTRLPLNQERGYNDYRQEGPYTDRVCEADKIKIKGYGVNGGYYKNYHDNYNDRQYTDRQYARRDDQYRGSPDRQYGRRDDQYRGSPDRMMDRRDQLNRSPERGYNSHPHGPSGAQTDRPEYRRADYRDGGYTDRGYPKQDMSRPYGINQTTQKDYGAMYERRSRPEDRMYDRSNASPERQQLHMDKMELERPKPYRGQLHQENEHFHNKNYENNQPENPTVQQSESREYPTVEPSESKEYPSVQHKRYMDEDNVDEVYLRPEEKQVRQRNMQATDNRQQALPYKSAPINEYRANLSQITGTGEVYLFIRARCNNQNRDDIKTSFKKHKTELQQEGGSMVGMAPSDMVYVMGDTSAWSIKSVTEHNGLQWYKGEHDIYCIKFSSMSAAYKWVDYNRDFKNAKFPEPDGVDIIILPINYDLGSDLGSRTFVMTFYPNVINDGLKTYIEGKTKDILERRRCHPFVASTLKSERKRGSWLHAKQCMVSLHAFNSLDDAANYESFYRSEVPGERMRDFTKNGVHTTMMFQLQSYP